LCCCDLVSTARGRGFEVVAFERGMLGVIGEAQLAGFALGALGEQSSEPFLNPVACCRWRCDDERALAVDRGQLDRLEPDRELGVADCLAKLCADLRPVVVVDGGGESESSPCLVQVDANVSLALATSLGGVGLLEDDGAS
jgi:hypothetical protein